MAEEQDFAFAIGLYRDRMFQIASEQFGRFLTKYPSSIKRPDAAFLRCECLFESQQYAAAIAGYQAFSKEYPASQFADNAAFRVGECDLKLGKPNDAIVAFKSVMDRYPDSGLAGEAAYWVGESYLKNEEYENAIKYYTLAYENYPKNRLRTYALYSVGWTLQQKGAYAKAAEAYARLIKESPADSLASSARVRIGECYYYAKDYKRAIAELEQSEANIATRNERGDANYLIAEAYYQLGDYSTAEKKYLAFLSDYPGHKVERDARYSLGWTYLKQQKYPQALQVFDSLSRGTDAIAHAAFYRKGVVLALSGDKLQALATYAAVAQRDPQGDFADNALYDAGLMYFEEKNVGEAEKRFDRVATSYPQSDVYGEACRMMGECLALQDSFQVALPWFEKAVASKTLAFESGVAVRFQIGWCYFKLKDFKEAAKCFAEFIDAYPQHPKAAQAQYWRGEALYQSGEYQESLKAYESAAASGGDNREEALYGIGWSWYKQNNFANAIDAFEKLAAEFPKGKHAFDVRLRLGDAYFYQKDYTKAAGSYRTVIRLYPDHDGVDYAYYQLAQSVYRMGDVAEAYKRFAALIERFPSSSLADDAQYALGWINFQKKEYNDAIKEFQKTIRNYPNSELAPRALYSLGDSYYNQKQYVAAEKSYREVMRQFPQTKYAADAITGVQYCLVAQGKQQEAVQVIDEFVKDHPDSKVVEELLLKKADLLFGQKKYQEAAKEYRAVAERFAKSSSAATATFWVGKCYIELNDPTEAALTFERAANIAGASPKVVSDALLEAASIYISQKKAQKGLEVLDRLDKSAASEELHVAAGIKRAEVYQAIGNTPEAQVQYETVIQNFPNASETDGARVPLARLLIASNEFDRAIPLAERVATSRTDDVGAEAQYLLGTALAGKKDVQGAERAFLKLRYVFPKFDYWVARGLLALGRTYEQSNASDKAKDAYQQVLKYKDDTEATTEAQKRLNELSKK